MNSIDEIDWKRAEIAVKKFSEASKIRLHCLADQCKLIKKLRLTGDSIGFLRERKNADRTVKQLSNDIQQITLIESRLASNEDVVLFRRHVNPIKGMIQLQIREFLDECQHEGEHKEETKNENADVQSSQMLSDFDDSLSCLAPDDTSIQLVIEELRQNAEDHERLTEDICELDECMRDISKLVRAQHEQVDEIEAHVENACLRVSKGEVFLRQALKHKSTLSAAAVGALIGGPAGFFIGAKAALLAAIGGSLIGAYGSKFVRRKLHSNRDKTQSGIVHSNSYPKID